MQRGLIKFIVIVIIAILVLSYLGFDIRSFIESEGTQSNLKYVWNGVSDVWKSFIMPIWNNYLRSPFLYIWNDIFVDIIWEGIKQNLDFIRDNNTMPSDLPQV